MKIQIKTALILLSALITIIGIFYLSISYSFSRYSYDDFYRLLDIRAKTMAKTELDNKNTGGYEDLRNEFFELLPNEKDYFYEILPEKTFEYEADELNVPVTFFQAILQNGTAEYNNGSFFYKGIKYPSEKKEYIVIASAENYFEYHHNDYLRKATILVVVCSLLFSVIISVYLAKYVFKPLTVITNRVKQISSENLHLRLDLKNNNDEMDELAATFNDMLNRIETSFETQNNFISNASHELRTPLTAIIGVADVGLSKLRQLEEYIETIKIILDEAEKLDKKTQALLFLAQTGFNGKVLKFGKVRIDQLIWDVKATLEKINAQSSVYMDTSLMPENPFKLRIDGNEQLLHLAFSNIISNACKYSDYKTVNVSIGASDTHVIVVVKDLGIGIPENELPYIYDPFFRASNTRNYEGYGIGLPLTRNIIRIHKGELLVTSGVEKGTTVQIKLPIEAKQQLF